MGFKNFEKKIWKIVPGVKCHPGVIGASNATWGYWGVKCHLKVMGRQMPPHGIGASNTTWGCWGVKGHPKVIGASKARGVKGPNSLTASKIRGVKGPYMGKGRKGHKASEFRESKFGRQGSRRQRSRASKEMNPQIASITTNLYLVIILKGLWQLLAYCIPPYHKDQFDRIFFTNKNWIYQAIMKIIKCRIK